MTFEDYRNASKAFYSRISALILGIFVVWIPAGMLLTLGPALTWFTNLGGEVFAAVALPLLAAFVVVVCPILLLLWSWHGMTRQLGLRCPHCAKSIAENPETVIASRNCPNCGQPVIWSSGAAISKVT